MSGIAPTLGDSITTLSEALTLEIGPFEAVHRWISLPECDEFVGARSVMLHFLILKTTNAEVTFSTI